MKIKSQIIAILMTIAMVFTLTACQSKGADFLMNGWDGGKDPTTTEPETTVAIEEETLAEGETAAEESASQSNSNSNSTANKNTASSGNSSSNKNTASSGSSKPSSSTATTTATSSSTKTYTAAEALTMYKNAANPIKTKTSGVTVTRTKEVYTEVGESNLSGLSGTIISTAFSPKTDTEQKVYSSQSDIIDHFVVEGQSYVCNLSTSDIKSASVKTSGNNKIVTIYVKDDTSGQNYSNKAVSATAVADLASTFSSGLSMSCKGVRVTATIDANGRLVNLNTYMPAYFTKGDEKFGAAIEQWWTISYK